MYFEEIIMGFGYGDNKEVKSEISELLSQWKFYYHSKITYQSTSTCYPQKLSTQNNVSFADVAMKEQNFKTLFKRYLENSDSHQTSTKDLYDFFINSMATTYEKILFEKILDLEVDMEYQKIKLNYQLENKLSNHENMMKIKI